MIHFQYQNQIAMKVLWFSPTPSLAEDYINNEPSSGGWIRSLEKEMQNKLDLSIAFYSNNPPIKIKGARTNYYPISITPQNKWISKIKNRFFVKIEPEADLEKYQKIIEEARPDLIHIHGTEHPFGLIQKFTTIPTVISLQGIISVHELKFFSGISFWDILRYSRFIVPPYLNRFSSFKKRAAREKIIFSFSKNFIGRTDWDRRVSMILAPTAKYFHNDEVLKEEFYEGEWKNELGDTLQLFTTTDSNLLKGLETIVHCANLLDENNVKFSWKVAGVNCTDQIVRIAQKMIKRTLSPNIQFMGKVNDRKLKESILNCNIYVCASHIENSPNSLCEALILGAPCISTDVGGISNLIKNEESGLLIQDGDPYSLAGAIIEMKENYSLAKSFGSNARTQSLIRHNKSTISNDLLNIYQSILEEGKQK